MPFTCEICETSFADKSSVHRHRKTTKRCARPGKPFVRHNCPLCPDLSFSRKDLLTRHTKEKHRGIKRKLPGATSSATQTSTALTPRLPPPSLEVPMSKIGNSGGIDDVLLSHMAPGSEEDMGLGVELYLDILSDLEIRPFDTIPPLCAPSNGCVSQPHTFELPFRMRSKTSLLEAGASLRHSSGKGLPPCAICHKTLSDDPDEIHSHIRQHAMEMHTGFSCETCGMTFTHKSDWQMHRQLDSQCKLLGSLNDISEIANLQLDGLPTSLDNEVQLGHWEQAQLRMWTGFVGFAFERTTIPPEADCWSSVVKIKKTSSIVTSVTRLSVRSAPGRLKCESPKESEDDPVSRIIVRNRKNLGVELKSNESADALMAAIEAGGPWTFPDQCDLHEDLNNVIGSASTMGDRGQKRTVISRPLTLACVKSSDVMSVLLGLGADCTSFHPGDHYGTALWASVWHRRYAEADLLLRTGFLNKVLVIAEDTTIDTYRGLSPSISTPDILERSVLDSALALAISKEDGRMAGLLLSKGAHSNVVVSETGLPAILHAVEMVNVEFVRLLMDYKCDLRSDSSEGSALSRAAITGAPDVVRELLRVGRDAHRSMDGYDYSYVALAAAARLGHAEVVDELLKRGVDPNIFSDGRVNDLTPIRLAVRGHHIDTIRILVSRGAKLDIREYQKVLPLIIEAAHMPMATGVLGALLSASDEGIDIHCSRCCSTPCKKLAFYLSRQHSMRDVSAEH